jgi:Amt family ammonium transporter
MPELLTLSPPPVATAPSRAAHCARLLLAGLAVGAGAAALLPLPHPAAGPNAFQPADLAWMLSASGLVLLMTPGLAFFYGGMVSPRNVISTMLQSFIALGIISLLWYGVGFSLAFGDSWHGLVGDPRTFFFFNNVGTAAHPRVGPSLPLLLFATFQLKFAVITPALITGALAERVRFTSYLLFISLFCLFIYCPLAHWAWHPDGLLAQWGVLDFAGGTVVHISAGFAALAGVRVLGPRHGYQPGSAAAPVNTPYVLLGTGLLWFGWFGFNAGSALGANALAVTAFFNTHLAGAAAMCTWLLLEVAQRRRPSALGACVGAVVGLVAITPAAGYVSYGASVFIGVLAAAVSTGALWFKHRTTLDDTLDVFPCHGVGGIVGMLATALFAAQGGLLTGGGPRLLGYHVLALGLVAGFTFGGSWLLLRLTNWLIPLRVEAHAEAVGLDVSQHGESGLPPTMPVAKPQEAWLTAAEVAESLPALRWTSTKS